MYVDPLDWTEGIESLSIYSDDKNILKKCKTSQYVKCNIPGPGFNIEEFEDQLFGCNCQTEICNNDCSCIAKYGKNYENKCLLRSHLHLNKHINPVFECNSQCNCSSHCRNRVVQHGINVHLEVFMTDIKGLGLRSLEKISAGQFVCEYAGEVLSLEEAKKRSASQTENDMNYILTVKEHHKNGVIMTHVDPSVKGNVGRYINHGCTPNLVMVPVRVDHMVPKVCLFALSDIKPYEELCFDYGSNFSRLEKGNQKSEVLQDKFLKPCFCKTEKCQGYLPFDETLFS